MMIMMASIGRLDDYRYRQTTDDEDDDDDDGSKGRSDGGDWFRSLEYGTIYHWS